MAGSLNRRLVYAERHSGTKRNAGVWSANHDVSSVLCLFLAAMGADAENSTQAGRFVVEHPTLLNLGFEWAIRGDANRNATVAVRVPGGR